MLSKRLNDIIFGGIIVVVIIAIFIIRVLILGAMDDRIERLDVDNSSLQNRITSLEVLAENHRDDLMPTIVEMHRFVPRDYFEQQLRFLVQAQLEINGISAVTERQRSVAVSTSITFPQGSEYRAVSENFTAYRVEVRFNSNDLTEVYAFLESMHDQDQLFLLQSVQYAPPVENENTPVQLNFITFYYNND